MSYIQKQISNLPDDYDVAYLIASKHSADYKTVNTYFSDADIRIDCNFSSNNQVSCELRDEIAERYNTRLDYLLPIAIENGFDVVLTRVHNLSEEEIDNLSEGLEKIQDKKGCEGKIILSGTKDTADRVGGFLYDNSYSNIDYRVAMKPELFGIGTALRAEIPFDTAYSLVGGMKTVPFEIDDSLLDSDTYRNTVQRLLDRATPNEVAVLRAIADGNNRNTEIKEERGLAWRQKWRSYMISNLLVDSVEDTSESRGWDAFDRFYIRHPCFRSLLRSQLGREHDTELPMLNLIRQLLDGEIRMIQSSESEGIDYILVDNDEAYAYVERCSFVRIEEDVNQINLVTLDGEWDGELYREEMNDMIDGTGTTVSELYEYDNLSTHSIKEHILTYIN
jgi:hypothetical protein